MIYKSNNIHVYLCIQKYKHKYLALDIGFKALRFTLLNSKFVITNLNTTVLLFKFSDLNLTR